MNLIVSTDKSKLDIRFIHDFLTHSYWAQGRTREEVERSIQNSICYGLYLDEVQVGFARLLTDRVAFAYLMDVFIQEEHRGKGLARILLENILSDGDLPQIQKWFLGTRDAQGLYEKFGFQKVSEGIAWMQLPGDQLRVE